MPGWRASRIDPNDEELPRCPQMRFDESDLVETGEALSPAFVRDNKGLEVDLRRQRPLPHQPDVEPRLDTAPRNRSCRRVSRTTSRPRTRPRPPSCRSSAHVHCHPKRLGTGRAHPHRPPQSGRHARLRRHGRAENGRVQVGINTLSEGHPFPIAILREVALRPRTADGEKRPDRMTLSRDGRGSHPIARLPESGVRRYRARVLGSRRRHLTLLRRQARIPAPLPRGARLRRRYLPGGDRHDRAGLRFDGLRAPGSRRCSSPTSFRSSRSGSRWGR